MSALGKIVYTVLSGQSGYASTLPGGLTPETNPQGNAVPYATYQGLTRQRIQNLDGSIAYTIEAIAINVVGITRAATQAAADWIATAIKASPGPQTVGSYYVSQLRIDDEGDQAESFADGSDDPARATTLNLIGTYKEV